MRDYSNVPDPELPEYEEDFPPPVPRTVPAGNYLCQFAGSCIKRTSQFGSGESYYYEMPLKIRDAAGNNFKYNFNFNPTNSIYADMVKLAGGKELPSRLIEVPPKNSIIGKLFMAQIIERQAKNDKNKIVNDILRVWPYEPKIKVEPEPEPQIETEKLDKEIEPIKEDFPKKDDDEVPF